MDMKWTSIIDGDLSGIPQQENLLFTIFDERHRENYVAAGWILEHEGEVEVREATNSGCYIHEAKNVKAWMDYPEPFNQKRHVKCVLTDEECGEVIKAMMKAILIIDEVEF